jgi:hypothetical protein
VNEGIKRSCDERRIFRCRSVKSFMGDSVGGPEKEEDRKRKNTKRGAANLNSSDTQFTYGGAC